MSAIPGHGPDEEQEISYQDVKVIGKGTFGVVYRAKLCESGQMVAIKKVFHNEKFKVINAGNSDVEISDAAFSTVSFFIRSPVIICRRISVFWLPVHVCVND